MGTRKDDSSKRRRNNEGSIYKEASGRWVAAISLGGGRRRRVYAKDAEAANLALIRLQGRQQERLLPTAKGRAPTLKAYLTEWLEQPRGRADQATWLRYKQLLEQHIIPELGHLPITQLTDDDVTALLRRKVANGMSTRTAYQHIRATLRTALGWKRWKTYRSDNPAGDAKLPKPRDVEMKTLTAAEVKVMIANRDHERDGLLYQFKVSTGLRLGEVLGLRWSDFDKSSGKLKVSRQLQRNRQSGTLALKDLKTPSSRRTLRLNSIAIDALETQRERQEGERWLAGQKWSGQEDLCFTAENGAPMDGPSITRRFHRFLKDVGLPDIRIHDLRHTYASRALEAGVPVIEVAKALGHSKPAVTLNVYGHASDEGQKRMASVMDSVFGA